MAHTHMLETQAPALYDLTLSESSSNSTKRKREDTIRIALVDVDESEFETFMRFVYVGTLPELDSIEAATSILLLSNRFGCTDLKLFCESTLVDKFLGPATAATLLLLAEGHSCALLKEAFMDLYTSNPKEVSNGKDWHLVEESSKFIKELLTYAMIDRHERSEEDSVTSLRKWLEDENLDVDGTRETLVKRKAEAISRREKNR
ncbi:unnamed protein product [Pseudo-nitzschia multistriata]|uniref:BTB domain-containing protein n=1 Tax=Pseudo-nitzschia multistriata TaxID=183589 RepID=A0A448ZMI7_9STRA|nr:unnamed protein product [Pseudo-nitzschia multistriata]